MKTVVQIAEMKALIKVLKLQNKTIGFVPTMGYLHEGHLSLIREAKRSADVTAVSIFVNPLQFGPKEDFQEYPRNLARDVELLKAEGVDYLFAPEQGEMYPPGYRTIVEVSGLQDKLCGRSRQEHFKGVTTVVLKLFNIITPDLAFFGQKDAQQAVILKKMAEDLNLDVEIRVLPIIREASGLALSSRNKYLSPEEKEAALVLTRSLEEAKLMVAGGERNTEIILNRMKEVIQEEPIARIDYLEIVDPRELEPLDRIEEEALAVLAVFIGKTRLIDNAYIAAKGERK